jgi:uncharacterized protein YcbK (DUF882 family)
MRTKYPPSAFDLFNKYFKFSDFDSPGMKGSGYKYMDQDFLIMLAKARHQCGVPFIINSGYRSPEYNQLLIRKGYKASPVSSHLKGLAADIRTKNNRERMLILKGLMNVGFTRIGISTSFIHVDLDKDKVQDVIWTY